MAKNLSKPTSKPRKNKITVPPELAGVVQRYYDRYLADASLSDLDVLLLSIYLVERAQNSAGADYETARDAFAEMGRSPDSFRKALHVAKLRLVSQEDSKLYFKADGLLRFRQKLGQVGKAPVYLIKSGETFSGIKLFEEFLSNEVKAGELLICDAYVSSTTLFPLTSLKGKISRVKLLTTNISDIDKFRAYATKLSRESGIIVETRISTKIHDRYLITKNGCWSIGSSIKDIGNKDTVIRDITEVRDSMLNLFNERWNESPSPG